jgi:hypothetical protein
VRNGRGKLERRLSGKLLPRDERSSDNGKETEKKPHPAFKAKVALEAVKEEKTAIEIAEIYDILISDN